MRRERIDVAAETMWLASSPGVRRRVRHTYGSSSAAHRVARRINGLEPRLVLDVIRDEDGWHVFGEYPVPPKEELK